ncbi:Gag Polyprotein [Plakobranchus ocellatus]|uniref:Gag Polyprotein n=1 Tax=Plakobranchus ocellatus TaxID=259542 RepID=A0AAV3Y2S7_9GAST|nr:Gag Polyprotein [Plakobranchus ocellatus]
MDITSEVRKKALLIHYGGDEIYDLIETFSTASRETYASVTKDLDSYFTPRVNPTFEAFKLRKMRQLQHENVDQFHVRLRTQAALCSFNDIDREILAQLIEGVTSSKLRRKALRDRLTLSQFIAEARNEELTDTQTKEIEASTEQACPVSARTHKKGAAKSKPWYPNPTTRKSRIPTQHAEIVEGLSHIHVL